MSEIYAINIKEEFSNQMYLKLLNEVSEKRRLKISQYKFKDDAKRSLFAGILVKYIIRCKFNLKKNEVNISYNEYGKSYIVDRPECHYNLSHSGDWVICGCSNHEIGVDIEKVKQIDFSIAKRFFTHSEYAYLQKKDKQQQMNAFFDLWTLKESYIKYKGKGLSIDLNSFEFQFENGKFSLNLCDNSKLNFFKWEILLDYKISMCCKDNEKPKLIITTLFDVWNEICRKESLDESKI